jgi:hypothetical protein
VQPSRKRWGVRTLAFLALGTASIIGSNVQGHYTLITFAGLVIGLVGAGFCSIRGLTSM